MLHQSGIDRVIDKSPYIGVAELRFCLALELRFGELNADYCGETLARIVAGEIGVIIL